MNKILIGTVIATLTGAGALITTQVDRSNTADNRQSGTGLYAPAPSPGNSTQPVTSPAYDDHQGYLDPGGTGGHTTQPVTSPDDETGSGSLIDYIGNHAPRESTQVYTDQYDQVSRDSARTSIPTNDPILTPGERPGGRGGHTNPAEPPPYEGGGGYLDPGGEGNPGTPPPYEGGGGYLDPGSEGNPGGYPPAPPAPPYNEYPEDGGHTKPVEGPTTSGFGATSVQLDPERYVQGNEDR